MHVESSRERRGGALRVGPLSTTIRSWPTTICHSRLQRYSKERRPKNLNTKGLTWRPKSASEVEARMSQTDETDEAPAPHGSRRKKKAKPVEVMSFLRLGNLNP